MELTIPENISWFILAIGAISLIYFAWGLLKASAKAFFYFGMILCIVLIFNCYNLLPAGVGGWISSRPFVEKAYEIIQEDENWFQKMGLYQREDYRTIEPSEEERAQELLFD